VAVNPTRESAMIAINCFFMALDTDKNWRLFSAQSETQAILENGYL
jgi:hypothetical protein